MVLNNHQSANDQIKNLVLVNLFNIFRQDVIFCGSLCDFFYLGLPISQIKDIDVLVPYEQKDIILYKILFNNFFIPQGKKKHYIKIYKTYDRITNFSRHYTSYYSYSQFTFKYRYSLSLLGINLDIFFYLDGSDGKKFSKNLFYKPIKNNNKDKFTYELPCGARILSRSERMNNLNDYINKGLGGEKHKIKLDQYNTLDFKIYHQPFITENNNIYSLPKKFSITNYLKYNQDLRGILLSRDAILSHYLSHGIREDRIYN